MGQIADTETAREFMKETLARVDVEELRKICCDVEAKSAFFRRVLGGSEVAGLDRDGFSAILARVFATRGRVRTALEAIDLETMRRWITDLLYGDAPLEARFDAFVDRLDGLPDRARSDFASELLHFTAPDRHWLWSRWMWDPKTRTGSLPLVTTVAYELDGDRPAEVYMKVGRATVFVHQVGEVAGFRQIGRGVFGTDVFLACVYVIYAYTVLRMRMTQEFNKVMPELPEFCRRLLGVHRVPESTGVAEA